ncbi:hypothetical protein CCGE525_05960 [Rhizobium jaguaris]|uniref:Uncharacterized protein n=1 Tax=Rhizobium jaguaris TaxID=1312183 RepID=A0A387FU75_9HYPH|nr:hypothetical protein CCGE525_05960 [Rhizobium jaguaris]
MTGLLHRKKAESREAAVNTDINGISAARDDYEGQQEHKTTGKFGNTDIAKDSDTCFESLNRGR